MQLIISGYSEQELQKYLLTLDGIKDVKYIIKQYNGSFDIDFDENIVNYMMINNYIKLFYKVNYSVLWAFKKKDRGNFNTFKYIVDDMCCEYCFQNLIESLYLNDKINSAKSDVKSSDSFFNVEIIIEYDKSYKKEDLIKFIEDNA